MFILTYHIIFTLLYIMLFIKGYPHYKLITSQNVPSEAQIKSFFIL